MYYIVSVEYGTPLPIGDNFRRYYDLYRLYYLLTIPICWLLCVSPRFKDEFSNHFLSFSRVLFCNARKKSKIFLTCHLLNLVLLLFAYILFYFYFRVMRVKNDFILKCVPAHYTFAYDGQVSASTVRALAISRRRQGGYKMCALACLCTDSGCATVAVFVELEVYLINKFPPWRVAQDEKGIITPTCGGRSSATATVFTFVMRF